MKKDIENEADDTRPLNDDAGGNGTNAEADKKHELFLDVITLAGVVISFLVLLGTIYFLIV